MICTLSSYTVFEKFSTPLSELRSYCYEFWGSTVSSRQIVLNRASARLTVTVCCLVQKMGARGRRNGLVTEQVSLL